MHALGARPFDDGEPVDARYHRRRDAPHPRQGGGAERVQLRAEALLLGGDAGVPRPPVERDLMTPPHFYTGPNI
jgi:hypothetical protein